MEGAIISLVKVIDCRANWNMSNWDLFALLLIEICRSVDLTDFFA